MKSFITAVICLMALLLDGCGAETEPPVQLANPFADCESAEEAEKISGFEFPESKELSDRASETVIRAEKGRMTEYIYIMGGGQEIRARKAAGNEDISGLYEDFSDVPGAEAGGMELTLKGNKGLYSACIWQDGDYSFSVTVSVPLDRDAMLGLASLFIPGADAD